MQALIPPLFDEWMRSICGYCKNGDLSAAEFPHRPVDKKGQAEKDDQDVYRPQPEKNQRITNPGEFLFLLDDLFGNTRPA